MGQPVFLAVDLGASSGRVLAGFVSPEKISLEELHRFENGPVRVAGRLQWDLLGLWTHIKTGLRRAGEMFGEQIVSVGVDTWGVDYGLLGGADTSRQGAAGTREEELLGNPYCYRDERTQGGLEKAFEVVSREEIFAETGLQFMELNTLYQLHAAKREASPLLEVADAMLMMPDLIHWLMTGIKSNEVTNASTTQLYNPTTGDWSEKLIERLGLPRNIFGDLKQAGTRLGPLREDVATETRLANVDVVLPGTHDTASAVAAVPATESGAPDQLAPNWCYVSSGTWSLVGVELSAPLVTPQVAARNFTNEAGIGGTTRLLRNVTGLWLAQQCKLVWERDGHDFDWPRLVELAESAQPLTAIINPDDPRLVAPANMPQTIAEICREQGQQVPSSPGEFVRCCLESVALRASQVIGWLEELVDRRFDAVHIVGGGSQNELLNQWTADACGRPVIAGPVEATALGNVLVQAQAAGEIESIAAGRKLIAKSFPTKRFETNATHTATWQQKLATIGE